MSDENSFGFPDTRIDRRRMLIGGGFLLTATAAWARQPSHPIDFGGKRNIDQMIPKTIGRWSYFTSSGLVVPPQDQLEGQLYSQLLTRAYTTEGEPPVMLLIAKGASQTGVLQVHRPEVCYPAGGYALSNREILPIPLKKGTLETTAFTATSDARTEQLLYWTRVGYDIPATWVAQHWAVAKANLLGDRPDAVLVRISTISSDHASAQKILEDFAHQMFVSLDDQARTFLIGPRLA